MINMKGGMNNVEYLLYFWGSYVFIDPLFCFCVHTQKNDYPLSRLYPPDHLRIYAGFQPSNVATGLTRIGSILSKSSFWKSRLSDLSDLGTYYHCVFFDHTQPFASVSPLQLLKKQNIKKRLCVIRQLPNTQGRSIFD